MRYLIFLLIISNLSITAFSSPRKLFLAIGVNNYVEPYWRPLKFADKDATDFANALREKFDGGMVLSDRQQTNRKVFKDDILRELDKLAQENLQENDVIVVYISGHGTVGYEGSGRIEKYLVTADSQVKNLRETALSHSELFRRFNALKSRRKVLILDSCYSGSGKSRLTENMMNQLLRSKSTFFKEPEQTVSEGTMVLSASAWGEEADESSELQNGLYTHFLIEGFDRDYNGDGTVTITEAHQFATQRVIEMSKDRQHPTARLEMVGQDPIIIRGSRTNGSPILFAYEWVTQKLEIELNGKKMGNLSKGGLLIPEGEQRLVLRDEHGKTLVNRRVSFEKGREYPLSHFVYEDPLWSLRMNAWIATAASSQDQAKAFPGVLNGFQLEVQREDSVLGYDLQLRALLLPAQPGAVTYSGIVARQDLEGARAAVLLGKQFLKNTRVQKDWKSFLAIHGGPSYISLQRTIKRTGLPESRQDFRAFGLAGSLEWTFESLTSGIQVGPRFGWEAYSSPGNFGPNTHVLGTGEIVAGVIW